MNQTFSGLLFFKYKRLCVTPIMLFWLNKHLGSQLGVNHLSTDSRSRLLKSSFGSPAIATSIWAPITCIVETEPTVRPFVLKAFAYSLRSQAFVYFIGVDLISQDPAKPQLDFTGAFYSTGNPPGHGWYRDCYYEVLEEKVFTVSNPSWKYHRYSMKKYEKQQLENVNKPDCKQEVLSDKVECTEGYIMEEYKNWRNYIWV